MRNYWLKPFKIILTAFILLGALGLLVMLGMTVANIAGRGLFQLPIYGSIEIVGLAGVFFFASAICYAQLQRQQITLRILVEKFPERIQRVVDIVISILTVLIVVLLLTGAVTTTLDAIETREFTHVMGTDTAPFRAVWAFGCLCLIGVLLYQLFKDLSGKERK